MYNKGLILGAQCRSFNSNLWVQESTRKLKLEDTLRSEALGRLLTFAVQDFFISYGPAVQYFCDIHVWSLFLVARVT